MSEMAPKAASDARIEALIDACIGNPFAGDRDDAAHVADLAGGLDLAAELERLLAAGDIERAKLLVLAVGHHRARRRPDDPAWVLADVVPPKLARKLPRPLGDYVRVVMAAGRCHRALSAILGDSAAMQRARRDVWAACFGDSLRHALELEQVIRDHDILLLGETGTGKEAFARAFQVATPGGRDGAPAPCAAINAAALPETLVESELFGHVKGAFTGATEPRAGRLRSADGGAFFLDEVGDLPQTTQVKLLRVIETNEVFPVGADQSFAVNLRYVAATHKDLEQLARAGTFRRDLYERLAGDIIRLPPLRDRPDDIVSIGLGFLETYVPHGGERAGEIAEWLRSDAAQTYEWPGNVRELHNVLRSLLLGLPPELKEAEPRGASVPAGIPTGVVDCEMELSAVEDWYIRRVVGHHEGNYSQAAKTLGIDRSTVRRRLKSR